MRSEPRELRQDPDDPQHAGQERGQPFSRGSGHEEPWPA